MADKRADTQSSGHRMPIHLMEHGFPKYERAGAYHWGKLQGRGKDYHARLWARYSWFVERAKERDPASIVDVGCGDAALTFLLAEACPRARVTGVEPEESGAALARSVLRDRVSRAGIRRGRAENLPFESRSVSLITSCEVIEHVMDARLLVREAARVLRADGALLVSTPQSGGRVPDSLHVHEFDPSELEQLLSQSFASVDISVAEPRLLLALYGKRYARAIINALAGYGANPFVVRRAPSRGNRQWHQLYAVAMSPY